MATIYARIINQYKFKYPILFSASLYKINEEDQRSEEIELFINSNIIHKLTENDIYNIDHRSRLEHKNQIQETKEFGWIFDKINSMKLGFYKTGGLNGSSFFKIPSRSNALLNIKNDGKDCFVW